MIDPTLLDSHSLTSKPLVSTEDFLVKFSECSLFTFSAKDLKTHKIFMHNKVCAELYGLEEKGLVGMTSRDCLEQVQPFTQREDALNRWRQEEIKAVTSNTAQRKIISILDYKGFVRVREHLTIPVAGIHHQTVAISAFCYDRTNQLNLLSLFKQYHRHYGKPEAITKLTQYLEIDNLFQIKLTVGELYTLLALVQAPRHKRAAYLLSLFRQKTIAPSTISGYVEHIKDKLKPSFELEKVLIYLRGLTQWTPDQDIF